MALLTIHESKSKIFASIDVDVSADTITMMAHGYTDNEGPFRLGTAGTIPGGLVVETDYWIKKVDDNTIQLAATSGGAAIDLTSQGAGLSQISLPFAFETPDAGGDEFENDGEVVFYVLNNDTSKVVATADPQKACNQKHSHQHITVCPGGGVLTLAETYDPHFYNDSLGRVKVTLSSITNIGIKVVRRETRK